MSQLSPLFTTHRLAPGMGNAVETFENEFLYATYPPPVKEPSMLLPTALDSGNTPNTRLLRRGLLMAKNRVTGKWAPWTPYTPNATTNNYFQSVDGILDETVDMTGDFDREVPIVKMARLRTDRLIVPGTTAIGLHNSPYRYLAARSMAKWLELDGNDLWMHENIVYVNDDTEGAFVLTNYPNNSHFIFSGANAVALTLPAPLPGLEYKFTTLAATADVTLTAATAGDIIGATAADDLITLTDLNDSCVLKGITIAGPAHKWLMESSPTVATWAAAATT